MKGWRITARGRKGNKEGEDKICSKTMCTHSKWANEQTLKTELLVPFYMSVHAFVYYK